MFEKALLKEVDIVVNVHPESKVRHNLVFRAQ
jgi:hypothetical protein